MVTTTEEILLKELKDNVFHLIFSYVPVKCFGMRVIPTLAFCPWLHHTGAGWSSLRCCDSWQRPTTPLPPIFELALGRTQEWSPGLEWRRWQSQRWQGQILEWEWGRAQKKKPNRKRTSRPRYTIRRIFSLAPWTRVTGYPVTPTLWLH